MWLWTCEHCGARQETHGPTSDGAVCTACGGVHRRRLSPVRSTSPAERVTR